jgi:hypothetical protein
MQAFNFFSLLRVFFSPHFSVASMAKFKDEHYNEQSASDLRQAGLK